METVQSTTPTSLKNEKQGYWLFVIPLFILNFLVLVDHLIIVPLSTEIAQSTGFPLAKSGLLIAIYPIASAISAFLTAPFSDRLGRKKMILILSIGFILSSLGFALSQNIATVFTFRILSGIFGGPITPNVLAYVGDRFTGRLRNRAVTNIMLAFATASIMGVPLGAWLGDTFSWRAPFYIITSCALFCFFFIIRFQAINPGATSKILSQYLELLKLWTQKRIRRIFFIQSLMIFGLFAMSPNLSVWLGTNYGLTPTGIGLLYMGAGIGGVCANLTASFLLQRNIKYSLVAIGSLFIGVFLLIATSEITKSPLNISLLFIGVMFGSSLALPAIQLILTEVVNIEFRGRVMSMSVIVNNGTMGIGGIWSLSVLTLENGHLHGMQTIGIVGLVAGVIASILIILSKNLFETAQENKATKEIESA